jgi:hypothetical protein
MSSTPSETLRLETFADAVFAIAITLLVIEIHLPPHEEVVRIGGVGPALLQLWPSYVGYVISFIVIGIMWANHHNLMKLVPGAFLYLTATLVAFVNVGVSLAIVVGLAALYMFPRVGAHGAVKR